MHHSEVVHQQSCAWVEWQLQQSLVLRSRCITGVHSCQHMLLSWLSEVDPVMVVPGVPRSRRSCDRSHCDVLCLLPSTAAALQAWFFRNPSVMSSDGT